MLEKPNIPETFIISCLQDEYDLPVAELTFLPIGADSRTAVYRVLAEDGTAYFLKLRKNSTMLLSVFRCFSKRVAFKRSLSLMKPSQSNTGRTLGAAFKGIHTAQIPPELKKLIPQETFSPYWRESMKSFQEQIENQTYDDPVAAKLAEFMKSKRGEISHLIKEAEQLTSELQSQSLEFVLCHTDIHGGNVLIGENGEFFIVDWDAPLLAPKERDLMFIGGGIDEIWKTTRDEAVFYQGYSKAEINLSALAYYRYERVIEDLAVICEQLLRLCPRIS